MRRPDSYASLQPTHSTIVSIINPSYRCLPASSKHTALPHSHLPHQPNPHSGVRGMLRAPSPAGSFLGGFRTPTTGVCRAAVAGRHPKPSTKAEVMPIGDHSRRESWIERHLRNGFVEPYSLLRYRAGSDWELAMTNASTSLSTEDADRFRAFERQRHDNLATTYHDFFTPVTALA